LGDWIKKDRRDSEIAVVVYWRANEKVLPTLIEAKKRSHVEMFEIICGREKE